MSSLAMAARKLAAEPKLVASGHSSAQGLEARPPSRRGVGGGGGCRAGARASGPDAPRTRGPLPAPPKYRPTLSDREENPLVNLVVAGRIAGGPSQGRTDPILQHRHIHWRMRDRPPDPLIPECAANDPLQVRRDHVPGHRPSLASAVFTLMDLEARGSLSSWSAICHFWTWG